MCPETVSCYYWPGPRPGHPQLSCDGSLMYPHPEAHSQRAALKSQPIYSPNSLPPATQSSMGCFPNLLKIRTSHKRMRSAPSSTHSQGVDADQDVAPSPSSEVTLKESLPDNYVSYGDPCVCCGTLKQTLPPSVTTAKPPSYASEDAAWSFILSEALLETTDLKIDELSFELRKLSLDIWEHPELGYEEFHAHAILTSFMSQHGFKITKHYLGFETAWRAEFSYGTGGRVIGLQSEMDALPNIGHACGHNLIAISGVAVALALKAAMEKHAIDGKIVLLGTPAEEHGGGKIKLLEKGGYKDMDVCMMTHPSPGAPNSTAVSPWTAIQNLEVEYFGHSAHAAYAPWEAQNALDAAFLAYSGISVLRQQMKPTSRVHGVVSGKDWEPNVIPDYSKMRWAVRTPSWAELETLRGKVVACLEAAAHATGCRAQVDLGIGYKDCRQNPVLGDEYVRIASGRYGMTAAVSSEVLQASTDAGDISYALPTIESIFSIPTIKNGSNHTPQFAESARTPEAHAATLATSKCLTATALRVLLDQDFYQKIRSSFNAQHLS